MSAPREPLAARIRPMTLDEVAGQRHLLAPGAPLRAAIEGGRIGSLLFWGPPGTGKTTIARFVGRHTAKTFVPFSTVTDAVARVREIVAEAQAWLATGRGMILVVDEIHRFHRAQQDAFLPHVEAGTSRWRPRRWRRWPSIRGATRGAA
jgi:putative ATPase